MRVAEYPADLKYEGLPQHFSVLNDWLEAEAQDFMAFACSVTAQPFDAFFVAATASSASWTVASVTEMMTAPLDGSIASIALASVPARHCPPIKKPVGSDATSRFPDMEIIGTEYI